jgi:microcystin-dependent protein
MLIWRGLKHISLRFWVSAGFNNKEFNTVEKTGEENTHLLTIDEIPAHSHAQHITSDDNTGKPGIIADYTA